MGAEENTVEMLTNVEVPMTAERNQPASLYEDEQAHSKTDTWYFV